MRTWIALFRGINVGGRNTLPMAALRSDLEALSLVDVRTYIQSGNAVFRASARTAAALGGKIADRIEDGHGFRPEVLVLSAADVRAAVDANPFPEAAADPKSLHLFFLAAPARDADAAALDVVKAPSERVALTDRVLYLQAPDGVARSKLASRAEKLLGVTATARNLRTVEKLLSMAAGG